MIIYQSVNLRNWIRGNTEGTNTVLELGAGFFHKLHDVHPSVKRRIGIEIWQPYIDAHGDCPICEKICGDALLYEQLVNINEVDTLLMVDILEHFDKEIALELLKKVITQFDKILLMIPKGIHKQNKDVTGYGAHEYQTHRSTWYEKDFIGLNPTQIIVDDNFHKDNDPDNDNGCMFILWNE